MNVSHNIANLNNALVEYQRLSGLTTVDVLRKQGAKLAREIHYNLRALAPNRSALKSGLLGRLRAGQGIKVRESIRKAVTAKWAPKFQKAQVRAEKRQDKEFWGETLPGRLNWKFRLQQKIVQAEIGMRVRGVGILGLTTKYPMDAAAQQKAISKYGYLLSDLGIKVNRDSGYSRLTWPGGLEPSKRIVEGLVRPRPLAAIRQAVDAVRKDIMVYVQRKQKELMTKAVRQLVKK